MTVKLLKIKPLSKEKVTNIANNLSCLKGFVRIAIILARTKRTDRKGKIAGFKTAAYNTQDEILTKKGTTENHRQSLVANSNPFL